MTPTKLEQTERDSLIPLFNTGWILIPDKDAISKEFLFADFAECFSFMTKVALMSEKLDHHPEWFNVYNKLKITWSTHDCQGLSQADIEMANLCDLYYKSK